MKGDIIPDGEFLYRYVNPQSFPDDQTDVPFGIFIDEELSCDWAAIQKEPEYSFHISEGKTTIVEIAVCDAVRNPRNPERIKQDQPAWRQTIIHDPKVKGEDPSHPDVDNPSHSLIKGLKRIHVTKAIAKNSRMYKRVDVSVLPPKKTPTVPPKIAEIRFIPGLVLALWIIAIILLLIELYVK
jgi:hypothetical protein